MKTITITIALIFALIASSYGEVRYDHECGQDCPRIYYPVCGFDGKEYQVFINLCLLKEQKCEDHRDWKHVEYTKCKGVKYYDEAFEFEEEASRSAKSLDTSVCPGDCPRIYLPVCGFNGVRYEIFSNDCDLEHGYCIDNKGCDIWCKNNTK